MPVSVTVVLLAAGQSNRFSDTGTNKLFLNIHGKTLLETVLDVSSQLDTPTTVVTGYQSDQVEAIVKKYPFHSVYNSDFESGMTSSIQCGVKHSAKSKGWLILNADRPFLNIPDLWQLVTAFQENYPINEKVIMVPTDNNIQKNPVIFSHLYLDEILNHTSRDGCKGIVRKYQKNVVPVPISNPLFFEDIDTIDDYTRLMNETI